MVFPVFSLIHFVLIENQFVWFSWWACLAVLQKYRLTGGDLFLPADLSVASETYFNQGAIQCMWDAASWTVLLPNAHECTTVARTVEYDYGGDSASGETTFTKYPDDWSDKMWYYQMGVHGAFAFMLIIVLLPFIYNLKYLTMNMNTPFSLSGAYIKMCIYQEMNWTYQWLVRVYFWAIVAGMIYIPLHCEGQAYSIADVGIIFLMLISFRKAMLIVDPIIDIEDKNFEELDFAVLPLFAQGTDSVINIIGMLLYNGEPHRAAWYVHGDAERVLKLREHGSLGASKKPFGGWVISFGAEGGQSMRVEIEEEDSESGKKKTGKKAAGKWWE